MVICMAEKIIFDSKKCTMCGKCIDICPGNALQMGDETPRLINSELCSLCGVCEDQCPAGAITIPSKPAVVYQATIIAGDPGIVEISEKIASALDLKKMPVGVKLLKQRESPPPGFRKVDIPLRHCVSVHMASLGASLYLPGEMHACSAAKAALGIAELPEKVKSGKVPYMHGLAASQKIAARIMEEVPKLEPGSTAGTLVVPLRSFVEAPDVVIITCLPKQAMWIANSLLYATGGPRITANFAGMQASCGDSTTLPLKTGKVNFSLGCYGCRSAGKLRDEEMYVGIPWSTIHSVVGGLIGLRKAMGKLEARAQS